MARERAAFRQPDEVARASTDPLLQLAIAMAGTDIGSEPGWLIFDVGHVRVVATHKAGEARLRIRAYLGTADPDEVESWTARQPTPMSGLLQIVKDDGEVEPRLLFERHANGVDWSQDCLLEEVREYAAAWDNDDVADHGRYSRGFVVQQDPRDLVPASAWLLLGDGASFPEADELVQADARAQVGIFDYLWTAAKQAVVGDLVLIYFLGGRTAAHFVARAASNAFFADDIAISSHSAVAEQQWWVYLTPPVPISPLTFKRLQKASNGHLILRGRSGRSLRCRSRQQTPRPRTKSAGSGSLLLGIADLPQPADITMSVWRALAAGALPLEAHVSSHIVAPMLEHVLAGTSLIPQAEFRAGRGSVDFVVLDEDRPVAAIEVKLTIRVAAGGAWDKSDDYLQLRRYMQALGVPGLLIDAHRIVLVDLDESRQPRDISRRTATSDDLDLIKEHVVGSIAR